MSRRWNGQSLVPITDVVEAIYTGKGMRTARHEGELLPMAGVGDIDALGRVAARGAMSQQRISLDELPRGPRRRTDYRVLLTRLGDVLVTLRGSVWKAGVVGQESVGVMPSNNLAVLRPRPGVVGGWLAGVLNSVRVRDQLGVQRGGPNMTPRSGMYLNEEDLPSILIPSPPPMEDQAAIVNGLAASASQVSALEAAVLDAKIAYADRLERLWG